MVHMSVSFNGTVSFEKRLFWFLCCCCCCFFVCVCVFCCSNSAQEQPEAMLFSAILAGAIIGLALLFRKGMLACLCADEKREERERERPGERRAGTVFDSRQSHRSDTPVTHRAQRNHLPCSNRPEAWHLCHRHCVREIDALRPQASWPHTRYPPHPRLSFRCASQT